MKIEGFFVEINLRKKIGSFAAHLLLSKYDNFMLIGDLNAEPAEAAVSDFCKIYNLKHLRKKTWFKILLNQLALI